MIIPRGRLSGRTFLVATAGIGGLAIYLETVGRAERPVTSLGSMMAIAFAGMTVAFAIRVKDGMLAGRAKTRITELMPPSTLFGTMGIWALVVVALMLAHRSEFADGDWWRILGLLIAPPMLASALGAWEMTHPLDPELPPPTTLTRDDATQLMRFGVGAAAVGAISGTVYFALDGVREWENHALAHPLHITADALLALAMLVTVYETARILVTGDFRSILGDAAVAAADAGRESAGSRSED